MLKIKLSKESVFKALQYCTSHDYGLDIVIENDHDILEWTTWLLCNWLLCKLTYNEDKAIEGSLVVSIINDEVIIGGDSLVLDAVRHNFIN